MSENEERKPPVLDLLHLSDLEALHGADCEADAPKHGHEKVGATAECAKSTREGEAEPEIIGSTPEFGKTGATAALEKVGPTADFGHSALCSTDEGPEDEDAEPFEALPASDDDLNDTEFSLEAEASEDSPISDEVEAECDTPLARYRRHIGRRLKLKSEIECHTPNSSRKAAPRGSSMLPTWVLRRASDELRTDFTSKRSVQMSEMEDEIEALHSMSVPTQRLRLMSSSSDKTEQKQLD